MRYTNTSRIEEYILNRETEEYIVNKLNKFNAKLGRFSRFVVVNTNFPDIVVYGYSGPDMVKCRCLLDKHAINTHNRTYYLDSIANGVFNNLEKLLEIERYNSKISRPTFSNLLAYRLEKPTIKRVVFNDPATIVFWKDGTKTVVKCSDGDTYSKESGLAMCFMKKMHGNDNGYHRVFKEFIK